MVSTATTETAIDLNLAKEVRKVYRYKLNYLDFLKMAVSDLFRLESYLFYQTEPLEIEVYLEEVLMSVNHNDFELGMTKFAREYYGTTEKLLTSLVTKDSDEGREFFRVQLNEDKRYLAGLIKSYMMLMTICRDIQYKLLSKLSENHKPITIVCSSYILNRLATVYTDQYAGTKIHLDSIREPLGANEAQVRDLIINMKCLAPRHNHKKLIKHFTTRWGRDRLREVIESTEKRHITGQVSRYIDALQIIQMYDTVTNQDYEEQLDKWLTGGMSEILLPYFNSPIRGVTSDWYYKQINFPRNKAQ